MNAATLRYYADLISVLVAKEFKVRYKSTFVGYAWSVLNPLAFAAVFFLVFSMVMRLQIKDYGLFLIAGLFAWQWFQNSLHAANATFLGNRSLIKKVRFPRSFLALAGDLNDMIHFLISIPVILLFMLYYRKYPSLAWLWQVPVLLVIQFLFIYGISLLVATCNLFFRDLERLTIVFTLLWFYLTPVLYPLEMIPRHFQWAVYANPMAPVILCWRNLFVPGADGPLPPTALLLAVALAWALAAAAIGHAVYRSLQWRFAEIV